MNFLTILLAIALAISLFANYLASRKIKWQDKTILEQHAKISMLQGQLEVQGKIEGDA